MRYIVYSSEEGKSFFDNKLKKAFKIDEEGLLYVVSLPVKVDSFDKFLKYLQPYGSVEETDKWTYDGERYKVAKCADGVTRFFDLKEQAVYALNGKEESFSIKDKDSFVHTIEPYGITVYYESNIRPTVKV